MAFLNRFVKRFIGLGGTVPRSLTEDGLFGILPEGQFRSGPDWKSNRLVTSRSRSIRGIERLCALVKPEGPSPASLSDVSLSATQIPLTRDQSGDLSSSL